MPSSDIPVFADACILCITMSSLLKILHAGFGESLVVLVLLAYSSAKARSLNFSDSTHLIVSLFVDEKELDDKTD